MVTVTKEASVKDLGTVVYCAAPFDDAHAAIEKKGRIISVSDLACARMQMGKDHSLSTSGSYVREGSLFVPNAGQKRYLLRNSLVLKDPVAAVMAHRAGNEYVLEDNFAVDAFLEKLKEGGYLALTSLDSVPTDRFGEDARMVWLFGKHARDYGLFLKDAGGFKTGFAFRNDDAYVDSQPGPFVDQVWLARLGNYSNMGRGSRYLDLTFRVRGVRSGEAREKKSDQELYTPKHIAVLKRALHDEGIHGELEKRILSGLNR